MPWPGIAPWPSSKLQPLHKLHVKRYWAGSHRLNSQAMASSSDLAPIADLGGHGDALQPPDFTAAEAEFQRREEELSEAQLPAAKRMRMSAKTCLPMYLPAVDGTGLPPYALPGP